MVLSVCIQCVELSLDLIQNIDTFITSTSEVECVITFYRSNPSEIMGRAKSLSDRIVFKKLEVENVGTARNAGLSNSTGDFILFCDSTDVIEPSELISLIKLCKFRAFELAAGEINMNSIGHRLFRGKKSNGVLNSFSSVNFPHATIVEIENFFPARFVISRSLFAKAGGWNEAPSVLSDFEFLCRLHSISKVYKVSDVYSPVISPLINSLSLGRLPKRAIDGTLLHLHLASSHLKHILSAVVVDEFVEELASSILQLHAPPNSPLHQYTKERIDLLFR